MKKQNTQSKIIIALSAIVVLLVAFSATITFAWFTASKSAISGTMTFGHLALDSANLVVTDGDDENSHMTTSSANLSGLVPGCTVDIAGGDISVTSNIASYVRFKVGITVATIDPSDPVLTDAEIKTALAGLFIASAPTGWVAGAAPTDSSDDGVVSTAWFYKNVASTSGTSTALGAGLPTTFTFPTTLDNDWQDLTVTVTLTAQAVQADHLTDGTNDIANGTVVASNPGSGEVAVAAVESATAWAAIA